MGSVTKVALMGMFTHAKRHILFLIQVEFLWFKRRPFVRPVTERLFS